MNKQIISGKIITLVAITITLIIGALLFFQDPIKASFISLLLILCCLQLYCGSKWPRWLIGGFLILLSSYTWWSWIQAPPVNHIRTQYSYIILSLSVVPFLVALVLIRSKNILLFLEHQRINRNKLSLIFKIVRIIVIILLVIAVFMDISRLY
jgi:hypothetical protein